MATTSDARGRGGGRGRRRDKAPQAPTVRKVGRDRGGAIAQRVIGYSDNLKWDAETIDLRVERALALRERVLSDAVRTACRIVHADGDGLPGIAVDRLGDFLLLYRYARAADGYL